MFNPVKTLLPMEQKSKTLHISLWAAQVVLGIIFIMPGFLKTTQPIDQLAESMPWVKEAPVALVRFIGISELLGALGLILPAWLRIKPMLTPLAAMGLFTIMVLAFGFHVMRSEYEVLPVNVLFGAIALFIAWGRYKKVPITAKG
jgi:uncharacterized membrane protein YphA (DoxX/SURF4 family)